MNCYGLCHFVLIKFILVLAEILVPVLFFFLGQNIRMPNQKGHIFFFPLENNLTGHGTQAPEQASILS